MFERKRVKIDILKIIVTLTKSGLKSLLAEAEGEEEEEEEEGGEGEGGCWRRRGRIR